VNCSWNRLPGSSSKIYHPVPNPGNLYPFYAKYWQNQWKIALLVTFVPKFYTAKKIQLLAISLMDVGYTYLIGPIGNTIIDVLYEKN